MQKYRRRRRKQKEAIDLRQFFVLYTKIKCIDNHTIRQQINRFSLYSFLLSWPMLCSPYQSHMAFILFSSISLKFLALLCLFRTPKILLTKNYYQLIQTIIVIIIIMLFNSFIWLHEWVYQRLFAFAQSWSIHIKWLLSNLSFITDFFFHSLCSWYTFGTNKKEVESHIAYTRINIYYYHVFEFWALLQILEQPNNKTKKKWKLEHR